MCLPMISMVSVISKGRFLREPEADGVVVIAHKKKKGGKVYKVFLALKQEYNHEQVISQILVSLVDCTLSLVTL